MKLRAYIYLFTLLTACFLANAQNQERILNFHSDIIIDTTGRVKITESITIYAEGKDIKRGLVRSIPLYRKENSGRKKKMDFTVLSVQRDGKDEPYHTQTANEDKEIFIGNSEVLLKPGRYKYTIVYETYGHIGFFDEYDELYWNVTGNSWAFQIEKVSASIKLPEGSSFINAACYTGTYGESNNDCLFYEQNGTYTFQSKSLLNPNEGLTVAIAFSFGSIKRPPPPTLLQRLWDQYGHQTYIVLALLILGSYYFLSWRKVGKDPNKPLVVPTFDPPNNWDAPTVRRMYKKTHDKKVLTVALIEMAVKRLIRIQMKPKKFWFKSPKYMLEKLVTEDTILTPEESYMLNILFPGESQIIDVSNENHTIFYRFDINLKNHTSQSDSKNNFSHNYKYAALGIILTTLIIYLYTLLFTSIETAYALLLTFGFFLIGSLMTVQAIFGAIKQQRIAAGLVGIIFIILSLLIQQIFLYLTDKSLLQNGFILLIELLIPIYFSLIKAPTNAGLQIDAELKGFQTYLKTAEENRLNLLTPPDRTPELFEKLLPYAIALDVENAWGKKFNHILKQVNYSPDWYQGTSAIYKAGSLNTFSRSFNSSLQHAKIDPTPSTGSDSGGSSSGSSSWDSGSSGGGFSGGGGGGGGGRGW